MTKKELKLEITKFKRLGREAMKTGHEEQGAKCIAKAIQLWFKLQSLQEK
jgi:hypothetical protein